MSKTFSKPTTKESYAMPKTQVQTPNLFEVLGKIPKPSIPSFSTYVYQTNEVKLLIQILEADHIFASEDFDFQKEKYFKSNDVLKTSRFYEFILVNTEFVQISHIKNTESTDIAYSKCKILKFILEKDWGQNWGQNPFTHKSFSQHFIPQNFDYSYYKEAWYNTFFVKPSSHSWFFNWGEKIQNIFPNLF